MGALCDVAAKAVCRDTAEITDFKKIAEGGSYRVFEVTFHDGLNLIARLPYPLTVPRSYGIASEVATMAFLRFHGLPVPVV